MMAGRYPLPMWLLPLLSCKHPEAAPIPANAGVLAGSCEASTVVPWKGGWLVGDNETKDKLFLYNADFSFREVVPLTDPVDDIEALVPVGDKVLVEGSYSRNKDAEERPERQRSAWLGSPARTLDLGAGCAPCAMTKTAAPNAGGLNVEGAAVVDGTLWLGLRAPIVDGKALLVEVPGGLDGAGASTGMKKIDLGGRGVREIVPYKTGWLLIGGPAMDSAEPHRLFYLDRLDGTPKDLGVDLPTSTEGVAVEGPTSIVYVVDGDGKNGKCKEPATWGRMTVALP